MVLLLNRSHQTLLVLSVLAVLVALSTGCESQAPAPEGTQFREELEKLNSEFTKLAQTRQSIEVKLIGVQQELSELDTQLEGFEDQERDVQNRINKLLGREVTHTGSARASHLAVKIILSAIGLIILFTLMKIRRSRLRDARRLQSLRQVLGDKGEKPDEKNIKSSME